MSDLNVKKAYAELVEFLQENEGKKVSTIMPQILEMVSGKARASTVRYDEEGNVTHIYCYYHKEWEDVSVVPYGKKANSTSGLNTMCKEGLSHWNRQQREKKKAEADLLAKVAKGEVAPEDIAAEMEAIEEACKVIVPLES